ncbi:hypothetical protein C2S53_002480 [Perilla frutescens var. hirtella]|uniref:Stress response protein NST1 n=1 Tax=Perilla frutescens var. hirtella TaxID=608512 RepID=A0AAD4J590_PERFH|nr:hypothetical protein C2S53_002480 [Perilla frutescens var. hirtella]
MPGIAQRINNNTSSDNNDTNTCYRNPSTGNGTAPFHSLNGSSISSNGFWSQHRGDLSYNQLQKFWLELTPQARRILLRIDKQTLFEHARKNMYCSRCNGLLLEGFLQIVMYGKSLQQDAAGGPYNVRATDSQIDGDLCMDDGCHDDIQDPSVHPWGGLTAARDGTLTLLDYYLYSKSLKGLQNVFDSARARERERELLYPDACGGGGRGWISQGITGYGRAHGTRETCALHTARLSVETLVDFWSALGEETRQSLLRMKEEDFIERLMYRFDSKRFCRDCRRNVIREFKELKELKRMRRETRCTSWFCVADTAFQYEVSRDTVQADWHQTFSDAFGTYHHFEWAIGTGEGKSDILEFENVGLSGRVQVNGLDLSGLNACYITLRAWKMDGRCNELCVKAHALRGQQCVHCRLVVGDGFVTITRGEGITRFFEHAEEAEEEEDDDSMDKDGNELDGECSRPQKHAKSPELAREFLLDAATVIFKEQVEKAFREGTARQNAHSIFVCLALKLLEERVHVACKEIITLEKQMKLLEEEEKEKREEEERKERRRTKEREKKLRRKERLREKENREKKGAESHLDPVVDDVSKDELTPPPIDEGVTIVSNRESLSERGEDNPSSPLSPDILDEQLLTGCIYSNMDNLSEDTLDGEFGNTRDWNPPFSYDHIKYSRRKLKFRSDRDLNSKLSDRRKDTASSENGVVTSKYESRYHADGFESTRNFHGFNKQLRTNAAKSNVRNGSKLSEKFQWSNSRICEKYGSHSCSCDQHHEYRSRPETHIVRAVKDPKYVNKSESPADISKPYYRSKRYTQAQCAREINGRPKGKIIAGNLLTTKKVWEPLDSQKKCVRSNSDSDVTLKSPPKVEAAESDQVLECCSSCSDEVIDNSVLISHKNNDPTDLSMSRAKNCGDLDNGFDTKENPHHYSKEAVAEDGELCSAERSTLGTSGSSMSTSSNSDNCSSCLSEGDSNTYSNHQNLESTSTSDSEESSQNSEGRVTSHCLGNGITAPHSVVDDQYKLRGIDATSEEAGTKPSSFLKEAAPYFEPGRENLTTSAQPQSVLPQMHNQSINYPVFQAPTVGYYHQSPVSWPVGSTNGLMSYPHASHYLFANTFGYGLNGNARIMQYGAVQHLPPSLHNHAHVPVFQPVSQVNGVKAKEPAKVAHLTALKEVRHSTQKAAATTNQHPAEVAAVLDAKQSEKPDKMVMGNDGFSLFHFGGPVALSTGFKADEVTLEEGIMGGTTSPNFDDGDLSSNTKDSIEEYNLFAANNGIQFSIF